MNACPILIAATKNRRGIPERFLPATLLAVIAMLPGCKVGPDYTPPEMKTPDTWVSATEKPEPSQTTLVAPSPITTVAWWTTFNDTELNKLIEKAAQQNLTVLQAEMRVEQARQGIASATSNLYPGASANAGYKDGASGNSPQGSSYSAGLSGGFTPLDVFGSVRRQIESAQATYVAAVENRHDALVTLVAQIGTTYIDLRTLQRNLDIARTNLDLQQQSANLTTARYANGQGFVGRLDVENAIAQVETTRAGIPSIEAQIRSDIYQISILLGEEPSALLPELDPVAPLPKLPANIPAGLPSDVLRRRPDIRAAEAQLHAATANVGVAVAQWFPQFNLTGTLSFSANQFNPLLNWAASSWSAGPSVTWQIFEGGQIIASVRSSKAAQVQAFYNYKSVVLTAFQQVETAMMSLAKEQVRRESLQKAFESNQRAYDLANTRYREGLVEFLDVLTAERSLYSSEQSLAQSDQAAATDLINLYKGLGGGWSDFPERDSVPVDYPPGDLKPLTKTPGK